MELERKLLASISGNDAPVKGAWIGLYWTAVSSHYVGMSHTYKTEHKIKIKDAGSLTSSSSVQLARRILSWEPLEASIGVAALNSHFPQHGKRGNVQEYIKEKSPGKTVTIIGRFPFNEEVSSLARKTYCLEIDPTGNELPMMACEEVMPKSDLNIISATALINHTLQRLLELGQHGINIVLGPSTPLSPVLFDFGADVLAGVKVTRKNDLVRCLTQGTKMFKLLDGIESIVQFRKGSRI